MRKITAIAWKDTLISFSSRSELLFFIILPVAFTYILASAFGGNDESGIPLAVVNEDGSDLAERFLATLDQTGVVEWQAVSAEEAARRFRNESVTAVLTIPGSFEADLLAGQPASVDLRKTGGDLSAEAVDRAVADAAATVSRPLSVARRSTAAAEAIRPFEDDDARQAYFADSLAAAQDRVAAAPERVVVTRKETAAETSGYDVNAQASVGQLITWVLIPLLSTSALLAYERNWGTLRRLVITPTNKAAYLLGMVTGRMGQAVVQMALLVVFGLYVMQVDWGRSVAGLAIILVAFALASVALGTMLGTLVRTTSQASNISIASGMALALLGGAWLPMEIFSPAAQSLARLLPTTWAMQGLTELTMRGGGLAEVLPIAGVLVGFAALFFVIGVWRFRYE